jgi:hypothetical protein
LLRGVAPDPASYRYGMVRRDDNWRLAARLIKMFGDGAEMAAAMYADKALARRDLQASLRWKRAASAIQKMQRAAPRKAMN